MGSSHNTVPMRAAIIPSVGTTTGMECVRKQRRFWIPVSCSTSIRPIRTPTWTRQPSRSDEPPSGSDHSEARRLGLERVRTAADALDVMTDLVSRYGQGIYKGNTGPGNYDNGFIVADPREAYVLETAGHQWAAARVDRTVGISNVYSMRTH